jgi:condensin complex subunit 3
VYEPPTTNGKGGKKGKDEVQEEYDEEDFNGEIERCVVRILGIKKSEPVGDRLIRFLGLFLKYALDKGKQPRSRVTVIETS